MTKNCKQCDNIVPSPYYYVKFKRSGLGEFQKHKDLICKGCFEDWKNHEVACENPPGECLTVTKVHNNIVYLTDNRPNADQFQTIEDKPRKYYEL